MLQIDCPYCGRRAESEFTCGGEAGIARPLATETLDDAQWADYLFMRQNPKGLHHELWRHSSGCGRWFNALRDTASHRFRATWKLGDAPRRLLRRREGRHDRAGSPRAAAWPGTGSSHFSFNGGAYQGLAGDTLASALLANDVRLVARSWKYHRPRGIVAAGVEEPNALVQLFEGAYTVPNARMTEVELVEGLVATSVNAAPGVGFDLRAVQGWFSRLIPAGFYYKTFMASRPVWHFFEKHIRRASGLGEAPTVADPDRYEKRYAHCDVLVVGAGIAGLCAALEAAQSGARVMLCDEQSEMGGWLLSTDEPVDGMAPPPWVAQALARLRATMHEVRVLPRTTAFGYHDGDFLTLAERRADHLPRGEAPPFRERLWKVRARQVVLATGAHERPLVFANNDLPGVMLASAVTTYVRRYAVLPGRRALVFTSNDAAYESAIALQEAGASVQVVDARREPSGSWSDRARALGIAIHASQVVIEARGGRHIKAARVQALDDQGRLQGAIREWPATCSRCRVASVP